jgi:hypothetical protein
MRAISVQMFSKVRQITAASEIVRVSPTAFPSDVATRSILANRFLLFQT